MYTLVGKSREFGNVGNLVILEIWETLGISVAGADLGQTEQGNLLSGAPLSTPALSFCMLFASVRFSFVVFDVVPCLFPDSLQAWGSDLFAPA